MQLKFYSLRWTKWIQFLLLWDSLWPVDNRVTDARKKRRAARLLMVRDPATDRVLNYLRGGLGNHTIFHPDSRQWKVFGSYTLPKKWHLVKSNLSTGWSTWWTQIHNQDKYLLERRREEKQYDWDFNQTDFPQMSNPKKGTTGHFTQRWKPSTPILYLNWLSFKLFLVISGSLESGLIKANHRNTL